LLSIEKIISYTRKKGEPVKLIEVKVKYLKPQSFLIFFDWLVKILMVSSKGEGDSSDRRQKCHRETTAEKRTGTVRDTVLRSAKS
jgi:hypothetical protein